MKKNYIRFICLGLVAILITGCSSAGSVVELGDYKGINVEVSAQEAIVTDEAVENALIEAVIANQEDVEITNRAVRNGDTANIDFSGKIDGELFEGGTDTGYDLVIGTGEFIPGFEDQVIGMKVGKTRDITVTFPESYHEATLAGKEAVFTVTLNSITGKENIPSRVTDAMITEISDVYTTVSEYREYLREELQKEVDAENQKAAGDAAWAIILDNSEITSFSRKRIRYYENLYVNMYKDYAEMYEVDLESLVKDYMGMTMEEFNADKVAYAEEMVTTYDITAEIAKIEGIEVTDEEFENYVTENGVSDNDKRTYAETIKDIMLHEKVLDFIVENATITFRG